MSTSLLGSAEPCNLLIYWLSIIYVEAGKTVGYISLCFYFILTLFLALFSFSSLLFSFI